MHSKRAYANAMKGAQRPSGMIDSKAFRKLIIDNCQRARCSIGFDARKSPGTVEDAHAINACRVLSLIRLNKARV